MSDAARMECFNVGHQVKKLLEEGLFVRAKPIIIVGKTTSAVRNKYLLLV